MVGDIGQTPVSNSSASAVALTGTLVSSRKGGWSSLHTPDCNGNLHQRTFGRGKIPKCFSGEVRRPVYHLLRKLDFAPECALCPKMSGQTNSGVTLVRSIPLLIAILSGFLYG